MVCRPSEGRRQQNVAGAHGAGFEDFAALDRAHDESGDIVFARGVGVRQFGGFAADQGAARQMAGARHAFDELLDDVGIDAPEGQIIEEKERLGAEREDVVDAVIDQVGAHGGVHAHGDGNLEFGAGTIGAGDQDGLAPALQVEGKQSAKGADAAQHIAREGARGHAANPFLGLLGAVDIHAGIGIAHANLHSPVAVSAGTSVALSADANQTMHTRWS